VNLLPSLAFWWEKCGFPLVLPVGEGGGSEGWVAFWSAEWSSGVLVEVVLGMVGHCDSPGLGNLRVGKYRVHIVHGIMGGEGNRVRWEAWFLGKRWEKLRVFTSF